MFVGRISKSIGGFLVIFLMSPFQLHGVEMTPHQGQNEKPSAATAVFGVKSVFG